MNDRVDWKLVDQAPAPYAKCAISGFGDGPLVDFGVRMHAIDPNVCINVGVLRDAARFVGMVPAEDLEAAQYEANDLRMQVERLEAEAAEANRILDAIDTFESAGFRARKKPGRPKVTA
jgi:hypothetical protein